MVEFCARQYPNNSGNLWGNMRFERIFGRQIQEQERRKTDVWRSSTWRILPRIMTGGVITDLFSTLTRVKMPVINWDDPLSGTRSRAIFGPPACFWCIKRVNIFEFISLWVIKNGCKIPDSNGDVHRKTIYTWWFSRNSCLMTPESTETVG